MSARAGTPFAGRTIAILVVVAVVGLVAYLVLTAYAGDLRPARNGGAHALSTSAVGFSGTAELLRLTGSEVEALRDDRQHMRDALLILTPAPETKPSDIRAILDKRVDQPTLVVLPKWLVRAKRGKPAWVEAMAALPAEMSLAPLEGIEGIAKVQLNRPGRDGLRTISGEGLETMVQGADGGALLASIGEGSWHMILADPDALNNHGLATLAGARRAMDIVRELTEPGQPVDFDVTLNGFGRSPNLLKLGLEAPFLPLTLCLMLAAILAVLHALRRFGPAKEEVRAIAFGKLGLAENGAALLRLARRRHRTGGRYAMLTRDAVAAATGAPAGLSGEALDAYLDKLDHEGEPFSSIAARAENAPDTRRLLAAVRDLYRWRRTVTREN